MMLDLIVTIMMRDGVSEAKAEGMVKAAAHRIQEGEDPDEVFFEELGILPGELEDMP